MRNMSRAAGTRLPFAPEHGGQGLPMALATAVAEMWNAANMGFALCPLLTVGARRGCSPRMARPSSSACSSPKLISGEWTGTMNLTEPQAGSDVGARAHARGQGRRPLSHHRAEDLHHLWRARHAPNIVHLVLARLPDAPPGTKGISLFLVPKFLVTPMAASARATTSAAVSSSTSSASMPARPACMAYGDDGGAIGTLVGEENRGMEYMFTMMNDARLNVGLQGVAIAERAYQQARDFARQRVQGRPVTAETRRVADHPSSRCPPHAAGDASADRGDARAGLYTAGAIDRARHIPTPRRARGSSAASTC